MLCAVVIVVCFCVSLSQGFRDENCYSEDQGRCFVLISSNVPVTWSGARLMCSEIAGRLVTLATADDQRLMERFLSEQGVTEPLWLGGLEEDGRLIDNDHTLWRWVGDCVECDITTAMTRTALEDQGCYDLDLSNDVTDNLTLVLPEQCRSECWRRGWTYAGITGYIGEGNGDRCLCGHRFGRYGTASHCILECRDDEDQFCGGDLKHTVYRKHGMFVEWSAEEPDDSDSGQRYCGASRYSNTGRVAAMKCWVRQAYACLLRHEACTGNLTDGVYRQLTTYHHPSTCLYVSLQSATWYQARQTCLDKNGDLLTFESKSQREEVWAIMEEVGELDHMFVGVFQTGYYWLESDKPKVFRFNNFAEGEPNAERGGCVALFPRHNYTWHVQDCDDVTADDNSSYVACEIDDPVSPEKSPSIEALLPEHIVGIAVGVMGFVVICIITLVLLLRKICFKQRVAPGAYDAREKATRPDQVGNIGDLDAAYDECSNTGSTANLLFFVEHWTGPPWKNTRAKSRPVTPGDATIAIN